MVKRTVEQWEKVFAEFAQDEEAYNSDVLVRSLLKAWDEATVSVFLKSSVEEFEKLSGYTLAQATK